MPGLIDGIYGQIIRLRNYLYDRGVLKAHWPDVPVISVGNITVGGTGKTPTVILLAELIKSLEARVGIILRGYGGRAGIESDETMLFRRRLGDTIIVANPNRVQAAEQATEQGADILIADDAFQHRRLNRDLDICLIDATFPFGGGRLLPIGRLREPLDSLNRADLIIITRTDQITTDQLDELTKKLRSITDDIPILYSIHKAKRFTDVKRSAFPLETIRDKKVFLFASIARPASFEKTIAQLNARIVGTKFFPDHHFFTQTDLQNIKKQADNVQADFIVCTEKDIVKLDTSMMKAAGISTERLFATEIEIELLDNGKDLLIKKSQQLLTNFSRDILKQVCTNE